MGPGQDLERLRFRSATRSHAGLRRACNEDRLLDRPAEGLWAVADGMGGHRSGDVAAARVVEALGGLDASESGFGRLNDLVRAISEVNAELFAQSADGPGASPSGATVVALLAHERHFACVWAGDSRAYLLRDGGAAPITRDHSLVQSLIDNGQIAADARRSHPEAHIITRAVGAAAEIDLERRFAPILPGDVFLLCSDGLTACVEDEELASLIDQPDLDAAAEALLAAALERGAPDNVSLVLIAAEAASKVTLGQD
ncbi:PP2C family serine/threonine-protein phosphatase [Phenylobacterium sp.]|uniref:PP2C family protein-serine/threonine phosphatase n=1 Tax=Phenylobacterium sp. TaxID=1871053 RepID=UPI002731EBA3|nr:protein phosphatase 2C domain-containing protein [Phenylobacterium sp.]MDP1617401.1 protein phosphatase 2C domain-containing protein [Phenylobacterium sp.]MDP1988741.1 protein phosphatase 2C domain-containing protein [Phenylobacterium sp.]